jgi:hypothetical protein
VREGGQALVFEVAVDTLVDGHEVREGVLPLRVFEVQERVLKVGLDIKASLPQGRSNLCSMGAPELDEMSTHHSKHSC